MSARSDSTESHDRRRQWLINLAAIAGAALFGLFGSTLAAEGVPWVLAWVAAWGWMLAGFLTVQYLHK